MPNSHNRETTSNRRTNQHNRWLTIFRNTRRGSYAASSIGIAVSIATRKHCTWVAAGGSIFANACNDVYSIAKNAETASQTPSSSSRNIALTYAVCRGALLILVLGSEIASNLREKKTSKWIDGFMGLCVVVGVILHIISASILTRKRKHNTVPISDEEEQNPAIAHEHETQLRENNGNDFLEDDSFRGWLAKRKQYRTKLLQKQKDIDDLFLEQAQLSNRAHKAKATEQRIDNINKKIALQKRKKTLIRIGYATEKSEFEDAIQQSSFHHRPINITTQLSQTERLQKLLSAVTNDTTIQVLEEIATIKYGATYEINIPDLMTNKYSTSHPIVIPTRIVQLENDDNELNNWVVLYVDPTSKKALYFDPYYESEPFENIVNLLNSKYNTDNFELITVAPKNLHYGHRSITWLTAFVRIMIEQTDIATITHTLTNLNIAAAQRTQEEMLAAESMHERDSDEQRFPEHVR